MFTKKQLDAFEHARVILNSPVDYSDATLLLDTRAALDALLVALLEITEVSYLGVRYKMPRSQAEVFYEHVARIDTTMGEAADQAKAHFDNRWGKYECN